jgi:hypothetical protein
MVMLGYSLVSATIPNLKSFIMSFDTALMMDVSHKLGSTSVPTTAPSNQEQASNRTGSASAERAPRLSDVDPREGFIRKLRPEKLKHTANIHHDARWSMSGGDISLGSLATSTSQDRIIRRDIHWDVEHSLENDNEQPQVNANSMSESSKCATEV